MKGNRQKTDKQLTLWDEAEGESRKPARKGAEPAGTLSETESPAKTELLMEKVIDRGNIEKALKRVMANKGAPGMDGMKVSELPEYLKENWETTKEQLLTKKYRPSPVRKKEIPKPGGGTRKLGIPTVMDRLIQQAILQVISAIFEPHFADESYGFRPGRSAHQAVARAQSYIKEGYTRVVDIDIEKFFDNVNHDRLMHRIAWTIGDKRVLKTIRAFLTSGVLEGGLVSPTDIGTPQGGPLSPLLSNIYLNDLDRELKSRGHRFVRYADDCNIYVKSERAGLRVMDSITRFLKETLKLKVNTEKSAVVRPFQVSFLGFSFIGSEDPKRIVAPKAIKRFKKRIRELTRRNMGISLDRMTEGLNRYLKGWCSYFGYSQVPSDLENLNGWIRRRLRAYIWEQLKKPGRRYAELISGGVKAHIALSASGSSRGTWRISCSPGVNSAYPNAYFKELGLFCLKTR